MTKIFLGKNFFWQKFFLTNNFFDKAFRCNNIYDKKIYNKKFMTKISYIKFVWSEVFWWQQFIYLSILITPFFWTHTIVPLDRSRWYPKWNSMRKTNLRSKMPKNGRIPSHQSREGAPIEHKNLQISVSQLYIFSASIQHL